MRNYVIKTVDIFLIIEFNCLIMNLKLLILQEHHGWHV